MAGQGDVVDVTEWMDRAAGFGAAAGAALAPGDAHADNFLELVGDPTDDEARLPNRPESATTARRITRDVLSGDWGLPEQVTEDAVLLVSELVGNAVRHTGARVIGLRLLRRGERVRAEVRDPSRGLPCLLPVDGLDTSGRGLFLVDTLAERWGVDLLPRGKTTWFEMRVTER